jgi:serine/threonine-protein phosphatase PGAM5
MANRFLHLARHGDAVASGSLSEKGRRQAGLLVERLAGVPLSAISHSPLPRATETAALLGSALPGVPVTAVAELGDYIPPVAGAPEALVRFLGDLTAAELAEGAGLAAAALQRYAVPADQDTHELIVTHSFQVTWFVRDALGAPEWRWLTLNAANCALTTILYRDDRPPTLVAVNDMAHLPPELRWTGFPPELIPEQPPHV